MKMYVYLLHLWTYVSSCVCLSVEKKPLCSLLLFGLAQAAAGVAHRGHCKCYLTLFS